MPRKNSSDPTIDQVVHVMRDVYLPRITSCLDLLTPAQIWWRPNEASNSVGNLVLHLTGNVRQWIVSGLGGAPDVRVRDLEFSERRQLSRRALSSGLEEAVREACNVMRALTAQDLKRTHEIQKYSATGLGAAFHVAEHFSHHAGQIILLTKMLGGRDLKFTKLPGEKSRKQKKLPTW